MENKESIQSLYKKWIDNWNHRDAQAMAQILAEDCNLVGYDGSQMNGRDEVTKTLGKIFADHPTAHYITLIREVKFLAPTVAVLRADAGMVPRGKTELNPAVNAVQTLIAVEKNGRWQISVFQNTPAAFHGRPEAVQKLTEELQQALRKNPVDNP
jgi:uncharacterized protein (TIGR02246 family)